MVDRLEELLVRLEEEDEEDEREDVPELRMTIPAAPVSEISTEEEVDGGSGKGIELPSGESEGVPLEAGVLSWMPDVRMPPADEQDEVPGADGMAGGAVEAGGTEREAAEFVWDELLAPVMGGNGTAMLRTPGGGEVELAELAGASEQAGAAAEMSAVMDSMTAAEKGLEGLYQKTVQASRPAAQSLPVEQAGRAPLAQEPGRTAALTVDELDRAVRRDSRRYDGGMVLF